MAGPNDNNGPVGGGGEEGGEFWQQHRHHHHHHHHQDGEEDDGNDARQGGEEGEENNGFGNPNGAADDGHAPQLPPDNNNPGGDGGDGGNDNQQIVFDDAHADAVENYDAENDGEENADGDGVIDGGVAVGPDGNTGDKRRSSDCDLVLLIECGESLQALSPNNHLLKKGATVSIGLSDKNTKLSSVFSRYCKVVNASCPGRGLDRTEVQPLDLEFYHCCLLSGSDTAEASALMKNDRIKARRVRTEEREAEAERRRLQRESDRDYFKQLRFLLPDLNPVGTNCDVMLDCRGKLVDENGYNQEVLTTAVRAHSALINKRCPWLGRIIQCAREEMKRKAVMTIPENGADLRGRMVSESASSSPAVARIAPNASSSNGDDDEDVIEMMPSPSIRSTAKAGGGSIESSSRQLRIADEGNIYHPRAAEVEDDDDDSEEKLNCVVDDVIVSTACRSGSPIISNATGSNSMLWVTLPDHPPQAVKLLLEYCYTNRVIPLGSEAFFQAGKVEEVPGSGPQQHLGPVPPRFNNSAGWPENGEPTISLEVALAGIQLAEEALMPRLSLMCECAAAQLVTPQSVLEVLSLCTLQEKTTGNRLPILRRATMMDHVLGNGPKGVSDLCRMPIFLRTLEERRALVVPSLLMGTMEVLPANISSSGAGGLLMGGGSHGRRRDNIQRPVLVFEEIDQEDEYARDLERKKWRVERKRRRNPDYHGTIEDEEDHYENRLMEEIMPDSLVWHTSSPRTKRAYNLKRQANQQHRGGGDVFAFGGVTSDSRSSVGNRREYGSGGRHGHSLYSGRRSSSNGRGSDGSRRTSRRRTGSLSSK